MTELKPAKLGIETSGIVRESEGRTASHDRIPAWQRSRDRVGNEPQPPTQRVMGIDGVWRGGGVLIQYDPRNVG